MAGTAEEREPSPAERAAARRREELERRVKELSRDASEGHLVEPARTMHEQRVWFIFELMIEGAFVTGRTPKDLAKMWGLSVSYVQGVAGEASRLYKTFYLSDAAELEALALRVRHGFEVLFVEAKAMAAKHGPYAIDVAGKQLANMALYAGIKPADKHEHTGKDGAPLQAQPVLILPSKDPDLVADAPDAEPAP